MNLLLYGFIGCFAYILTFSTIRAIKLGTLCKTRLIMQRNLEYVESLPESERFKELSAEDEEYILKLRQSDDPLDKARLNMMYKAMEVRGGALTFDMRYGLYKTDLNERDTFYIFVLRALIVVALGILSAQPLIVLLWGGGLGDSLFVFGFSGVLWCVTIQRIAEYLLTEDMIDEGYHSDKWSIFMSYIKVQIPYIIFYIVGLFYLM